MDEINEVSIDALNHYIVAKVVVSVKDYISVQAKIIKCKCDNQVNSIGKEDASTILDLRLYELELPYGQVEY